MKLKNTMITLWKIRNNTRPLHNYLAAFVCKFNYLALDILLAFLSQKFVLTKISLRVVTTKITTLVKKLWARDGHEMGTVPK